MKPRMNSKTRRPAYAAIAVAATMLSACGNLSGLDGSPKLSCKAPEGVHCASVTANYYNRALEGSADLPHLSVAPAGPEVMPASRTAGQPGLEPQALRSPVRVVRLWVKAWEDSDRDLVDQSYVYVRVDDGQWQVAHVQRAARAPYAPLRPPSSQPSAPAEAQPATSAARDGTEVARGAAPPLPNAGPAQ